MMKTTLQWKLDIKQQAIISISSGTLNLRGLKPQMVTIEEAVSLMMRSLVMQRESTSITSTSKRRKKGLGDHFLEDYKR